MNRITLISQYFFPEMISTGHILTELLIEMSARSVKSSVICAQPTYYSRDKVEKRMRLDDIDIVRTSNTQHNKNSIKGKIFNSSSFFILSFFKALFKKEKSTLLLVTNPPFLGALGPLLKLMRREPYVLIIHDLYPHIAVNAGYLDQGSPVVFIWNVMNRIVFRYASFIVTLGRDVDQLIKDMLPEGHKSKVVFIPNWADPSLIEPVSFISNPFISEKELSDKFIVQYSGNMGLTHDMETIIEAANVLKNNNKIHFLLIGDGGKRKIIEKMIESFKLNNVTMLPYQPRERLKYSLSASHVSLISQEDSVKGLSVPSKLYGIMASGRPAIAIAPGESEVALTLNEFRIGIVTPPKDVENLVQSIIWMLDNESEREAMGKRAYKGFLEHFTVSRCADKYINLLDKV
jgi:glycosyltransferase involved in cell wall biosynthesis